MAKKKVARATLKQASILEKLKKRKAYQSAKEWLASFSKKKKKKKQSSSKNRTHSIEDSSKYFRRSVSKLFKSKLYSDFIRASADPKRIPKKIPKKKIIEKEKKND